MQGVLGIAGAVMFLCILFFFPETSHPGARGIDKLQLASTGAAPRSLSFINPFKSLLLLRSPNLLAVVGNCVWLRFFILTPRYQSLASTTVLLADYGEINVREVAARLTEQYSLNGAIGIHDSEKCGMKSICVY
jgi:hypothetical protein